MPDKIGDKLREVMYKGDRKLAREEYGKVLARMAPWKLLIWAIFVCIAEPIIRLVTYLWWRLWLYPRLDAEIVRIRTENSQEKKGRRK